MTEPRDESFERLLRQTISRPPDAGAPSPCLDAETMAAWLDGALAGAELEAVEAHAATCELCRAHAAMVVRNQAGEQQPAVSSSAPEGTRARRWWPLLVPAAAAAVLTLAIFLPRRSPPPAQESTIALAPPAEIAPQARPLEVAPQVPPAEPADTPPAVPPSRQAARSAPPAPAPPPPVTVLEQAAPVAAPMPSPAPPPPPLAAPPAAVPAPTEILRDQPAPAIAGAARAFDRAAPVSVVAEFESPDPAIPQTVTGVDGGRGAAVAGGGGGGRGGAGAGAAGGGRAAGDLQAFRTPPLNASRPTRWRVILPGSVERSNPAGAPWQRVALEPGLLVTNGHAPSPLVCWLVGRAGLVLLTVDGQSFRRLPFPEAADLGSVRATTTLAATVTTLDGRTFTTADGGQNWVSK